MCIRDRHITLDPTGRGVVRIHMIPPREDAENAPFLLLLNGSKLVPLNLSWAILLSCSVSYTHLDVYKRQTIRTFMYSLLSCHIMVSLFRLRLFVRRRVAVLQKIQQFLR